MALHKAWILAAVAANLARIEEAKVTVKNVPNKGDEKKVPFDHIVFATDADSIVKLFALAEAEKGTTKDDDGNEVPNENPLNTLLTYAYGLNCRAKVRAQYEGQFEDPEKGIKKIAEMLVKTGRFKTFEKALAAARLMQEDDEE
jgi:hypothetical protein